ncbi:MAG: toll/interleukin-1 receptor domain-containing protein [Hyphomonadaceae bacterium]
MTDVFISYKKEDAARVAPIAQALAQAGYEVWWDHRIPPGRTYREVIGAALQSAKCVIVVWSKLSAGAQWVLDEADEGKRRNVLLPLMLDDVEIPYGFRQIEAARLVGWRGDLNDPEWQGAVSAVAHFVGRAPGGPARPLQTMSDGSARQPAPAAGPTRAEAPSAPRINAVGPLLGAIAAIALLAAGYFAWRAGVFGAGASHDIQIAEQGADIGADGGGTAVGDVAEPAPADTSPVRPSPREEQARPQPARGRPGCYWLSDDASSSWRPMPQYSSIEQCFAQDSCDGGLGQSGGGCYKWAEGADAPRYPWPTRSQRFACYWLSNDASPSWRPMPQFSTIQQCFAQDSCDGGLGQSGGGCYKWAAGPDAPRQPW